MSSQHKTTTIPSFDECLQNAQDMFPGIPVPLSIVSAASTQRLKDFLVGELQARYKHAIHDAMEAYQNNPRAALGMRPGPRSRRIPMFQLACEYVAWMDSPK